LAIRHNFFAHLDALFFLIKQERGEKKRFLQKKKKSHNFEATTQKPNRMNIVIVSAVLVALILLYFVMTQKPFKGMMKRASRDEPKPQIADLGMYDAYNPNVFGTTKEQDRRVTNYGVRPEYHHNPMPLGEGCGDCDKYGVADPAMGHSHVCKAGPPSKRMIDAYGGSWFSLPHMCAPATGAADEPTQLGRWWRRSDCSAPESVGLDIRPLCTRCGN
jgi:hypothetical protein